MSYLLRKMLSQGGLMDQNKGDGSDSGGGDDGGAAKIAAALAAEKAAADKTAADKVAAEKAAADAAAAAKDGKNTPTDAEAALLKENMKKKEELKKAADEKAALEAKLKAFDGIDPEAVKKLLEEQKAAETKSLEAKGNYDLLKARMAEEHAKEIAALTAQLAAANGEASKAAGIINELSVGTQFGQSAFISDELTLPPAKARALYAGHFELEDGKVVGYDKPRGSSGRTPLVDQYGVAVGFDAALKKIVDADPDREHLYKSKTKPGAGSDSKKQMGVDQAKDSNATGTDKIAAGLKGLNIGS